MVLPVGVGIDGRIRTGVVAPLVDFTLRETRCLTVGDKARVLQLHEVGIVCHEIKVLGDCLK